uniref:Uncharacterized protein n=1 Tax=Oryza nivara TaxID=4536 RepID=A0A0E0J1C6_ORYNI
MSRYPSPPRIRRLPPEPLGAGCRRRRRGSGPHRRRRLLRHRPSAVVASVLGQIGATAVAVTYIPPCPPPPPPTPHPGWSGRGASLRQNHRTRLHIVTACASSPPVLTVHPAHASQPTAPASTSLALALPPAPHRRQRSPSTPPAAADSSRPPATRRRDQAAADACAHPPASPQSALFGKLTC